MHQLKVADRVGLEREQCSADGAACPLRLVCLGVDKLRLQHSALGELRRVGHALLLGHAIGRNEGAAAVELLCQGEGLPPRHLHALPVVRRGGARVAHLGAVSGAQRTGATGLGHELVNLLG